MHTDFTETETASTAIRTDVVVVAAVAIPIQWVFLTFYFVFFYFFVYVCIHSFHIAARTCLAIQAMVRFARIYEPDGTKRAHFIEKLFKCNVNALWASSIRFVGVEFSVVCIQVGRFDYGWCTYLRFIWPEHDKYGTQFVEKALKRMLFTTRKYVVEAYETKKASIKSVTAIFPSLMEMMRVQCVHRSLINWNWNEIFCDQYYTCGMNIACPFVHTK